MSGEINEESDETIQFDDNEIGQKMVTTFIDDSGMNANHVY